VHGKLTSHLRITLKSFEAFEDLHPLDISVSWRAQQATSAKSIARLRFDLRRVQENHHTGA
jgi:hypothetical protein